MVDGGGQGETCRERLQPLEREEAERAGLNIFPFRTGNTCQKQSEDHALGYERRPPSTVILVFFPSTSPYIYHFSDYGIIVCFDLNISLWKIWGVLGPVVAELFDYYMFRNNSTKALETILSITHTKRLHLFCEQSTKRILRQQPL